jgi:excisionase family DNA binding protein
VDEDELTISVPEAGRRLGLGKNASYAAARRGELPVLSFGRKLRVPRVAYERMLSEAKPAANTTVNVTATATKKRASGNPLEG